MREVELVEVGLEDLEEEEGEGGVAVEGMVEGLETKKVNNPGL